ncbi:MAG: insulinase family protein, partial [Bdellovibrionales bacterium]|nr:insulinase family protein [Bdellovibrionales bacterium]
GEPIFGTEESLAQLTPQLVERRRRELLQGRKLVIVAAGNVIPEQVFERATKTFGGYPAGERESYRAEATGHGVSLLPRPFGQVHFVLGQRWAPQSDSRYLAGMLLATALGDGVSSRLFLKLREESGLLYDIGADTDTYPDTAALTVSGAVEREKLPQVLEMLLGELDKVRQDLISEDELRRAAALCTAQLEMEHDSVMARLWRAVETELIFRRYISAEESIFKINSVSLDTVREVADQFLGRASSPAQPADPNSSPSHVPQLLVLTGDVDGLSLSRDVWRACGGATLDVDAERCFQTSDRSNNKRGA